MTDAERVGTLVRLSATTLAVADPTEDVRGRTVLDRNGEKVGEVDELLLDDREHRVRFLQVGAGGFLGIGEKRFLIPVDAVTRVEGDHVHIDRERARLTDVPGYDPELTYDPAYYGGVYDWWGYGPYWAPGYAHPAHAYPVYPAFPY